MKIFKYIYCNLQPDLMYKTEHSKLCQETRIEAEFCFLFLRAFLRTKIKHLYYDLYIVPRGFAHGPPLH